MHKQTQSARANRQVKNTKTTAARKIATVKKTKVAKKLNTIHKTPKRFMSVVPIDCPPLGDSVLEGDVIEFKKQVGDWVNEDDPILVLETAKVSIDIPAPKSGILTALHVKIGDVAKVGDKLADLDISAVKPAGGAAAPPLPKSVTAAAAAPAAAPATPATPAPAPVAAAPKPTPVTTPAAAATVALSTGREDRRVKMTRMRQTIASRLKDAQNTGALLTTFNEIDMTNAFKLRSDYKDEFEKKHGVKLGFMSIFMAAATNALMAFPDVNASIEGNEVVYRNYVDISVAVSTPTGLVVPVVRDCQNKSLAQLESAVGDYAKKARSGQIAMEDFVGGTFSISNGGVYGSLWGTPIVNPPQTAILGMHGIKDRPVAINGQVEIRKMMYIALTYDHRLLDGSTAVQCLKAIKESVENPERMLLKL
jgi:2-oxoglutarate dehydrogenase E2 component (dihydrolipoamide succinyltransferase)